MAAELRAHLAAAAGDADDTVDWPVLASLLATMEQRSGDPVFAATLLDLLGADRFQRLPELVRASAARWSSAGTDELFLGGLSTLSAVLVTASHTVGQAGGLSDGFLTDLVGPPEQGTSVSTDEQIDQVQEALSAAGLAPDAA